MICDHVYTWRVSVGRPLVLDPFIVLNRCTVAHNGAREGWSLRVLFFESACATLQLAVRAIWRGG